MIVMEIMIQYEKKGGDSVGASLEIKKALLEKDMQVKDLAKLLNCTPENLYLKFKRDNWKEKDVQEIADVLGYDYQQLFIKK